MMKRAYYSESIEQFLFETESSILGKLTSSHTNRNLEDLQINAWKSQIQILKNQLKGLDGKVYFEFAIPRMGKRVDNIIIVKDTVFVVEFKVGSDKYEKHAVEQVIDYSVDLKNFHEGSHYAKLIPVLVSTDAREIKESIYRVTDFETAEKANQNNLEMVFRKYINAVKKI